MTTTPSTHRAPGEAAESEPQAEARRLHPDPSEAAAPVPGPVSGPPISPSRPRAGNAVPEARVAALFDDIAPVYDRVNTVMTLGADRRWRRAAVEATGLSSGDSVIDVACGTGKLSTELAERVGPFGRVLGVDLSPGMVELARAAHGDLIQVEFRVANALDLPAADDEFDAATIAFGLRNLADFSAGFAELRRVVRPGGLVVCLELSMPRPAWWGRTYHALFRRAAPLIGGVFQRRSAYAYLPESLQGFPQPDQLAATMRRAGLVDVGFCRLALGAVAIHRGRVPPR
jgi:demethylmenaquinone methyltransferase/2-methoxy-6-polyprenyl-1,4-benzoquinol methylase